MAPSGIFDASVMFFNIMGEVFVGGDAVQVAPDPHTSVVDILKLAHWASLRDDMLQYTVGQSEQEGTLKLSDPRRPTVQLGKEGLMGKDVPLFLVLEELRHRGKRRMCQLGSKLAFGGTQSSHRRHPNLPRCARLGFSRLGIIAAPSSSSRIPTRSSGTRRLFGRVVAIAGGAPPLSGALFSLGLAPVGETRGEGCNAV